VLGHHNVGVDAKAEVAADALEGVLKDLPAGVGGELGTAVITTKRHEMALPGLLITLKAPRHEVSVVCAKSPLKAKEALSGPPCFKMELSVEKPCFKMGLSVEKPHSSQNRA
jgi:hypothetical protein